MIFVTVGTQPNGFLRCLKELELLIEKYNITEEVVAQIGNTDFETDKFKTVRFTGENEFKEYIKNASVSPLVAAVLYSTALRQVRR